MICKDIREKDSCREKQEEIEHPPVGEPAMVLLPLSRVIGVPFYGIWDDAAFDGDDRWQEMSCQQEDGCACD